MQGKNPSRRVSLRFLVLDLVKGLASAKQQRDAPNTCKAYQSIDDAAEQRGLSATDPGNDVKLKQSDAAPVERAYNGQNQRNAIQYHHYCLLFVLRNCVGKNCATVLKFRLFVVCVVVLLLCMPSKKRNFVQKNALLLTNVCN